MYYSLFNSAEVFGNFCFSVCPLCLVPVHGLMLNDDSRTVCRQYVVHKVYKSCGDVALFYRRLICWCSRRYAICMRGARIEDLPCDVAG